MTLRQKQSLFVRLMADWVLWVYEHGYELTDGEAYRTPEQAALNAARGIGIANSLHTQRLARDFNLFKNGKYLTTTESWRVVGEKWEGMHPLARWGGRFLNKLGEPAPDGNHLSLEHNGVK